MSLESMVAGLIDAEVEFVVIGGVAGNLLGSARITNDLDICYRPTDENRTKLVAVLIRWEAYLRGVERGLPFTLDARMLRDVPVMTLIGNQGWIDVMDRVQGIGEFDRVLASSAPAEWNDMHFRTLTLDALITAKRSAGRRRDIEALLELEALREIRKKKGI